jgi:hypothetical protein
MKFIKIPDPKALPSCCLHVTSFFFFFFFHINVLATVIYKRYILPSMNVITIGTLRGQGS